VNPDDPLLPLVARGDPFAVRACIGRHGPLVWALARRLSPTPQDAEDAVQEIFLDLWKNASRYEPEVASETAFIAMIARRRLVDRLRARRRRPATDPISDSSEPLNEVSTPASAETCVEAARASDAIAALRSEERQVLLLAVREGCSHEEIATRLGLPLGTVKTYARRALSRVRAALGERASKSKGVAS
jgi:RNA polymerase sigma-70 factor (ECF subfamily)